MGAFSKSRTPAAARYSHEDYNTPTEGTDEAAVLANQAEQAMEDVISGSEELEAMGNDGEELAETYGEILPEVQQIVEQSQDAGGLTVESVSLLALLGNRIGLPMTANVATESYSGGRSNQARRAALEAVGDHLGNWWQALKRWLKKMWKKLKDWWNKTFSGAATVKAAAEALKKRAQGMSNKTVKNENVTFSGAEYLIDQNGKVTSSNIQSGVKAIDAAAETLLGDHQRRIGDACKEVVSKMSDINFDAGDGKGGASAESNESISAVKEATGAVLVEMSKTVAALGMKEGKPSGGTLGVNPVFDKNLPANAKLYVSPAFPGNRVLYVIAAAADSRFDFDSAGNKTPDADFEPKALSISEVTASAGVIADLCNTIIRANSSINSADKIESDLEAAGDKVERVLASTDKASDGSSKLSGQFARTARNMAAAISEPQHKFTAYALNVCNAVIRYGNASLATTD